ncbi:hypothetical protein ACSSZE_03480 [Acidithiobacillus caldus]
MINERGSSDLGLTLLIVFFFSFAAFLFLYHSPAPVVNPAMGAVLYQQSLVAQAAGHLHRALRDANQAIEYDPQGKIVGLKKMVHHVVVLEADIRASALAAKAKRTQAIQKEGVWRYYWTTTPWYEMLLEFVLMVGVIWFVYDGYRRFSGRGQTTTY